MKRRITIEFDDTEIEAQNNQRPPETTSTARAAREMSSGRSSGISHLRSREDAEQIATAAYHMAEAMLIARRQFGEES